MYCGTEVVHFMVFTFFVWTITYRLIQM
jgi:hypothetical protein